MAYLNDVRRRGYGSRSRRARLPARALDSASGRKSRRGIRSRRRSNATTEADPTQSPSFDEQKKGVPQSLLLGSRWLKGMTSSGIRSDRKGCIRQDPRLKPIEPGSVFPADIPAIYIVFESAPLEDPLPSSALNGSRRGERARSQPCRCLGKDILEVPGHERYGFWNSRNQETPDRRDVSG